MKLYHVTTVPKARLILRRGFDPYYTKSEFEFSIVTGEQELNISREDPEFWDKASFDSFGQEQQARELFDEILSETSRGRPTHDNAVFFWPSLSRAHQSWHEMMYGPTRFREWDYVILEVDTDKIPGSCYQASQSKVEEMFDEVSGYCGDWCPSPEEENRDRFYELAEDYYKTMKIWEGDQDPDLEVLCSHRIPPESVVDIHIPGHIGSEIRLPSRGRGWHFEPTRHALAARGIRTR